MNINPTNICPFKSAYLINADNEKDLSEYHEQLKNSQEEFEKDLGKICIHRGVGDILVLTGRDYKEMEYLHNACRLCSPRSKSKIDVQNVWNAFEKKATKIDLTA